MINNDTQAILEFIKRNTNGFISLSESFIDQQHDTIKTIKEIQYRLENCYNSVNNYEKSTVIEDVPNLHDFKNMLHGLLYLIKYTFQDEVQKVVTKEIIFGLSNNKYYSKYEDIFPKEFTQELQSKIGLTYEKNNETESDDKEQGNDIQIVKFHNPFNIPFSADRTHQKTIETLGYGSINEIKKITKALCHCVLSLAHDLPELIETVKNTNMYATEILSQEGKELTEDGPKKVMDSVLVWGSLTESCLRAITFYTRTYQEILNTLYKSIINKNK